LSLKPLLLLLCILPAFAALRDIHVLERTDIANGKSFAKAGPYEKIVAKAFFEVDPRLPANRIITDIRYAPTNDRGMVEFSADVVVIKPREPANGNGSILYEVSNRGGRGLAGLFSYATQGDEVGDGLLFNQGFTLAWVGWQFDVPQRAGVVRVDVPVARGIKGLVRAQEAILEKVATISVADRNHIPYPAIDPNSADNVMTVREYGAGPRKTVPRSQWRFTDPVTVTLDGGFLPGKIYEVVYTAQDPGVAGLGLAAIRDFIGFLKYGGGGPTTILSDQRRYLKRAIAFGSSQSGRLLRTYLHQGFNADEQGRKVFDGMMPHIAGGSRGSFVHRFAQPSRLGSLMHGDLFPFHDLPQTDPVTGLNDGILRVANGTNTTPKIFYTNTANEYWRSSSSLTHTSPDGATDAALAPGTRIYFLTGSQHGSGGWPPAKNPANLYSTNTLDYRPLMRALLIAMNEWVTSGKEPPPSQYPTNAARQLVAPNKIAFPAIPQFRKPAHVWQAHSLDYGPDYHLLGIITKEPPVTARTYGARLPQIDADGNETSGIRSPGHAVPLGTHMGWNTAAAPPSPETEIAGLVGSYIAFPKTAADRQRTGDSRRSIEERYKSRADYLAQIDAAANKLIADRYLLSDDLPRIQKRAAAEWDTLTK